MVTNEEVYYEICLGTQLWKWFQWKKAAKFSYGISDQNFDQLK
jgi:hypothetical protein